MSVQIWGWVWECASSRPTLPPGPTSAATDSAPSAPPRSSRSRHTPSPHYPDDLWSSSWPRGWERWGERRRKGREGGSLRDGRWTWQWTWVSGSFSTQLDIQREREREKKVKFDAVYTHITLYNMEEVNSKYWTEPNCLVWERNLNISVNSLQISHIISDQKVSPEI